MPTQTTVQINSARLTADLATLAGFTSGDAPPPTSAATAVTRIVFTEADLRARAWLKSRASEAGFSIREDAVGNTFLRFTGTDPTLPAIGTGSHIDAIPHAGMYDGTVGVLGGLEALRALKESGFQPRRSLELLLFTSEEPTRFGIGCLGSRILSGALDPARADALSDVRPKEAAHTLVEVRQAAGFTGPLASTHLPPGYYHAWLELHIEQGPLLERENIPIGIVTSIAAPAGYRFTITGFGGHAGALLMPDRRDALCAAAELILAIERHTLAANTASGTNDAVATVGALDIHPGNVNSVSSRVTVSLDIRDIDPARRESIMGAVRADLSTLQQRRHVTVTEEQVNADDPAPCSPHLIDLLATLCAEQGIAPKHMVSRAYHDSLFMAPLAPIAMIFIPCRNGVSHRPEEYASQDDIARGTHLLATALARLSMEERTVS